MSVAKDYHFGTRHDPAAMGTGSIWRWRPEWDKRTSLGRVELPDPLGGKSVEMRTLWESLYPPGGIKPDPLDLGSVAGILHAAFGVTRRIGSGLDGFSFRAAASAGALYPNEVYLVSREVQGLEPGVYRYNGIKHCLEIESEGFPGDLTGGLLAPPELGRAPAFLLVTGVPGRSALKYGDRAYRYVLMDAGHILANAMLVCAEQGLACSPMFDFIDEEVNLALDLDGRQEFALAVLGMGHRAEGDAAPWEARVAQAPDPGTGGNPLIRMHTASCLKRDEEQVRVAFERLDAEADLPADTMVPSEVVRRRRSRREFMDIQAEADALDTILGLQRVLLPHGTCGGPVRFAGRILIHSLEGWEPGLYEVAAAGGLEMIREGSVIAEVARASLYQEFVSRASLLWTAGIDMDTLEEGGTERLYRHALLQAGMAGEGAYLAAIRSGLGACGIGAFFDDALARAVNLDPIREVLVYYVAVGSVP